jgi:CTP synthase
MILSDDLTSPEKVEENLRGLDAIVVPGGFGDRGIEGKLNAIQWARVNKKPLLGLCLGLQCVVIEYARNVLGLKDANSVEFNAQSPDPVIHLMEAQKSVQDKGATMRLGTYPCKLTPGTNAYQAYESQKDSSDIISERHRHRYEFNNAYRKPLEEAGLKISGLSPDGELVEIVEIKDHPYFLACQFHPEFLSRPGKPHPLFLGLIKAAINQGSPSLT